MCDKRIYSRTPLILNYWNGERPGYPENPDNWTFV